MRVPAAQTQTSPRQRTSKLARVAVLCGLAVSSFGPLSFGAAAQGKPDQVHVWNARRGETQVFSGVVAEDSLERVKLTDRGGKEIRKPSLDVRRIVWGNVPGSYTDGKTYLDRGDFENAVTKFRTAATDSEARDVVKAAARYHSTEALLGWGATDASRFTEAVQEADRFLSSYTDNRYLPFVRSQKARATLLTGDSSGAGALFRSLFDECKEPSETYGFTLCAQAGKSAGHALLQAQTPDTVAAREVFSDLDSLVSARLVELDENDPDRGTLESLQQAAQLGEGYVLLASSGQARQARLFFENRAKNLKGASAELRFGTLLGLGQALQAEDEKSAARVHFATVAALDHTDRDRTAAALLGLAQCYVDLKDSSDWSVEAKKRLTRIGDKYGDTPSARKARELLEQIN